MELLIGLTPIWGWVNGQFRVTGGWGAPPPLASTEEESVNFFQDLLMNEKLRPNYYVLYHSAMATSVRINIFQNILAELLTPEGFSLFSRFYTKKEIGGTVRNFRDVNDAIPLIRDERRNDTEPEISPHIMSSSYSLFGNGGNNSAITF